jgi:hypothetical protein
MERGFSEDGKFLFGNEDGKFRFWPRVEAK